MKGCYARLLLALLSLVAVPAIAQTTPYVDAVDYPGNGLGWEAFRDLERRLERDFDQICGDTFCEGEYSNYMPLRFRCSVELATGLIGQCAWTFGASEISVESSNGQLQVDARTWTCPTQIPAGLTLPAFYKALHVDHPLFVPLPGGQPIYDGLIDCL
jgi:hypothetical protein